MNREAQPGKREKRNPPQRVLSATPLLIWHAYNQRLLALCPYAIYHLAESRQHALAAEIGVGHRFHAHECIDYAVAKLDACGDTCIVTYQTSALGQLGNPHVREGSLPSLKLPLPVGK